MKQLTLAAALLLAAPSAAAAQEHDVSRRSYPFLEDRLVVQVQTETPGALRVVRGDRGRVEVAGRVRDGVVGFGMATQPMHQLRLTSVGGDHVEYLVVVPEHVHLSVQLPREMTPATAPVDGLYRWGGPPVDPTGAAAGALLSLQSGLQVVHTSGTAPALLDVPDLAAVRSLSVRFQGEQFRVTASRPVRVESAAGSTVRLAVGGEPVDIVVYVPTTARGFAVHGEGRRLVAASGGRPVSGCSGVAVQEPTPQQIWFTFYPRSGRPVCG